MYQALYRKWRPRTFDDVVGQSHITDTLKRQVATGRLSHAYLFTGTRGTGKTTCAKILARAVNCEHPVDGNPCNQCPSCLGIESGSILDVLELDAASNNGVDQVRALRDEAVYTPAAVRKRVYIVDEVHMLSTAAFNALLKILEEPPEHLMFILATTELHKVPATIKSRCQQFSFKRILPGDIAARLARVEELLAGGIPAACAVPGQPMKQSAPAKREPSAPRVESAPAEHPPWEEERPPLPDEPGERVDVDETPEPSTAPEDRLVAGEAPTGGEAGRSAAADLWPGLVAAVRGKFPAVYPFLSNPAMVQGRLEDGVLTLWVKDEFTKSMVGGASILEELGRLASAQTGVPARCAVKVGKAPAAPAAAAPAQAAEHDKLDDLLAFSRQFDNIIIQE